MAEKAKQYDSLEYYKILDISPSSTEEEIRQKYRELAKYWHPDYNKNPQAVDMFQKISVAYEILKDKKSRLKYTLLSFIYDKNNFPNINSLCVLKNMHGEEDINLHAIHLIEVTGKILGHSKIDKVYYCNNQEAPNVVKRITKHNWVCGFWGITAFFVNIVALIKNIFFFNRPRDNLLLMLHNSLSYESNGKYAEALTLALKAREYADKDQLSFINEYIQTLASYTPLSLKKWKFSKLKRIQLFYPIMLFVLLGLIGGLLYLRHVNYKNSNQVNVKKVVILQKGQKVFSDVAVAKIFDIPVDVYDNSKLYHVTTETKAMHGADKSFDVFSIVSPGTTVRLTGYTGDKKWYRVMFDSGEMAFIEADKLKKGIGKEIPLWSKIYKE